MPITVFSLMNLSSNQPPQGLGRLSEARKALFEAKAARPALSTTKGRRREEHLAL